MHIETQAKSSVCPMTKEELCLGRQRIDSIHDSQVFDSRAIFANSERLDSQLNLI